MLFFLRLAAALATGTAVLLPSADAVVCSLSVSPSDAAVGISIVADTSCQAGDLGCINSICRYCAVTTTPQSSHLPLCTSIGATLWTTTPVVMTPETTNTPTATPTPLLSALACAASAGDKAVGVQVVPDAACVGGGLGCLGTQCRMCKLYDTTQSTHLLPCASLGYTFAPVATAAPSAASACTAPPGDAAVGVTAVADSSCQKGGLGCYSDRCRYCRSALTPQSAHLLDCFTLATGALVSAATTTAPTTPNRLAKGAPTVSKTATEETVAAVCTSTASAGDYAVGIRITTDPTCASDGVGCIDAICRFCQAVSTPQSAHLEDCTDIVAYMNTFSPQSATPEPVVTITAPTSAPTTTTATRTPTVSSNDPAIPLICDGSVTQGDAAVGIAVVTDQTCSDRGVGCLDDICRLCKRYDTPQSQVYKACSDIPSPPDLSDITFRPIPVFGDAGSAATTDPVSSVTESPVTPDPSEPVVTCSMVVSDGDAKAGLDIVVDADCLSIGGVGCMLPSACKFCKRFVTPQSAVYDDCNAPSTSSVLATRGGGEAAPLISDMTGDSFWVAVALATTVACLAVVGFAIVRVRRASSGASERSDPSPAINEEVETSAEVENANGSTAEEALGACEASE